jgi:hypothetical protein
LDSNLALDLAYRRRREDGFTAVPAGFTAGIETGVMSTHSPSWSHRRQMRPSMTAVVNTSWRVPGARGSGATMTVAVTRFTAGQLRPAPA